MQHNEKMNGRLNRLRSRFPDREFFMRSQGQVRFITITSRMQIIAASLTVSALLILGLSMAGMAWSQYSAASERGSLLQREAQVADAEGRVSQYRNNLDETVTDLTKRQDFLEAMTESLPADAKAGATVNDSSTETAKTVSEISAAVPEATELARVEARQLAYVERLTRYADSRSARAAIAIRKLGLDPTAMTRDSDRAAMGGPLELLATAKNGSIDPRFERLGLSLGRMSALERGLQGIPQVLPAAIESISSGFGYRRDPFNGGGAMHSGLDFRGPTGAPIYAAAKGKVTYAGRQNGYGNVVEITHGNGLMTRYAHMSRFVAKVGHNVTAGAIIGAIGSTGRSTGPHLHFEVRINDRAVNPLPFLETAPHVLEEARGRSASRNGK